MGWGEVGNAPHVQGMWPVPCDGCFSPSQVAMHLSVFFMGDFFALCQSRCCALVRDAQVRSCNLALLSTEKGGDHRLLPCLSSSSYTLMHPEAYIFFSF